VRVRNWGQIPAVTYTFLFSMLYKYKSVPTQISNNAHRGVIFSEDEMAGV
jgi:hypothetical protein